MLVGSTEWAETHASEVQKKTLIYINSDTNGRGFLQVGGSQDFQHFMNLVAADVMDPETGVSIGQRFRAHVRVTAMAPDAKDHLKDEAKIAADPGRDFLIEPLGSGSDFSVFLDHLGVPAMDVSFADEGMTTGVYHSRYDTFEHHSRFVDPGFIYDALLAKTAGRMVLRASEAKLPLQRESDFADALSDCLDDLKKLAGDERQEAETQALLLRDRVFQLADDPTKSSGLPIVLDRVPHVEFAALDDAVDRLKRQAKEYDDALAKSGPTLAGAQLARLQELMLNIDQLLAPKVGLPGRPWYRNLIYAPGRFTGYEAKTMPGVREAIEDRRWADANRYAKLTADAINAFCDRLAKATSELKGS